MIFGFAAAGSLFPLTGVDEEYLDELDDRLRSGTLAPGRYEPYDRAGVRSPPDDCIEGAWRRAMIATSP
jgi:hypothetical protein